MGLSTDEPSTATYPTAQGASSEAATISPWSVVKTTLKKPALSRDDAILVIAALVVATVVRLLLDPLLGNRAAHGTFLVAVVFIAWSRGLWAALTTVVIGALLANFLFVPPRFSFVDFGIDSKVTSAINLFLGVATAIFSESLRAAARENDRLYRLAKEADLRKEEFLAMVSHELRNPLAPISNAVYMLSRIEPKDPRVVELQDLLDRQVHHLLRLVNDLLDVSRITRGKINLHKAPVELAAILDEAIEVAKPFITEKQHTLTVTLPASAVYLYADSIRLTQAFANLLNNAARYTSLCGHIWLSAECTGDDVTVRLRDNGIGIASEELTKVFELFEQARTSPRSRKGGLGIGLAIVRTIVEMHQGRVEAQSPGVGLGSEFTVHLPISSLRPSAIAKPDAKPRLTAARHRRILVVDDNAAAANSMGTILKAWKHDVQVRYDSFSALETARFFKPDVVLTDLGLPQMDGFELARQLRKLPGMEHTLLVAVTGYGQPEDLASAKAAGFDKHLVKPLDPNELEELVCF